MDPLQSTTLAAFNALLEQQRKLAGAATKVSLLLFNESCQIVLDGYPLPAAPDLTPSTYQPYGSTALWDAMGTMIETLGTRLNAQPKHSSVLVVTITNGQENASHRFSLEQLRKVIQYRQNVHGWRFILISQKAASVAFKLGIPLSHTCRRKLIQPGSVRCSSGSAAPLPPTGLEIRPSP
jgi:hypothetical protein